MPRRRDRSIAKKKSKRPNILWSTGASPHLPLRTCPSPFVPCAWACTPALVVDAPGTVGTCGGGVPPHPVPGFQLPSAPAACSLTPPPWERFVLVAWFISLRLVGRRVEPGLTTHSGCSRHPLRGLDRFCTPFLASEDDLWRWRSLARIYKLAEFRRTTRQHGARVNFA